MKLKKSLLAAVVAIGAVVAMSETSHAFFGLFRGGSCGSYGGWGGSYGGWGGSYGGWGSHGGWAGYGSAGSWGGYGSYGGGGYAVYDQGYFARRVHPRHHHRRFVSVEPRATEVIAAAPASKTTLTLHVPADAKVTLAGVPTKQTGEVRRFTTTRLSEGQVWDDYKVVVEMDRGGQTVREERTISLTGGRSQELAIDLDRTQLAQR